MVKSVSAVLEKVYAADMDLGLKGVPTIVAVGNTAEDAQVRLRKELTHIARDLAAIVDEIECGKYVITPNQYYIDTENCFFDWHKTWCYVRGLTLQGEGIDTTAALQDMAKKAKMIVKAIYSHL